MPRLVALLETPRSSEVGLVSAALEVICCILKLGQKKQTADGNNPFFAVVERCGGVERIEDLQSNKNKQIRDQALAIVKIFEQDRVEQ